MEGDEVLLTDPDESFSGFGSEELPRERQKDIEIITKQREKQKATSKTAKKNPKQPKNKGNKQSMSSIAPISDNNLISDTDNSLTISGLINRISSQDIDRLRQILGVIPQQLSFAEEEDIETIFGDSLNNLPNLHIELTNDDSEGELDSVPVYKQPKRPPLQPKAISYNLRAALFDENLQPGFSGVSMETVFDNGIDWDLPKLKQPEKGLSPLPILSTPLVRLPV